MLENFQLNLENDEHINGKKQDWERGDIGSQQKFTYRRHLQDLKNVIIFNTVRENQQDLEKRMHNVMSEY